ncbi:MAG: carbohydrate-binding protein [Methanospirillum sp.]|nr:carbohydrate-binding protein [Methanospirillum sp.]
MTLRVLSLLIICICIAPLAVQADAAVKVMPLGDSITRGGSWTTSPYPSYRYYLDESLRASGYSLDFVGSTSTAFTKFAFDQNHEGHGGYTTGMMVGTPSFSPLAAWLASSPAPDIVLLHVGTNDALEGIPLATRIANMKKIVSILRQKNPGVRVLMAQIIPTGDAGLNSKGLLLDFNRALPSIAAGLSTPTSPVAVVDLFTGYDGVADNQPDGIHPKTSGERKMAGAWHRALAPVLSRMSPGPGTTVPTVRPTVTRTTQAVPSLSVRKVPGVLEAEDYDPGGAGVSYRDTTPGNSGGAYRQDDVDIEVQGGTTNLAFVRDGEWLQYTVAVSSVGRYRADFRVSSWGSSSHSIAVSVNGKDAATVSVPTTGGPGAWTTASTTLPLPSGTAVLRFRFSGDGQNLDRVTFSAVAGSATVKPTTTAPTVTRTTQAVPSQTGSAVPLPGTIQSEDYNPGGEGVSYHDTTPGNQAGAYRGDGVDIVYAPAIRSYVVTQIRSGEWLEYTVTIPEERYYQLAFRLASQSGGQFFDMKVDGRSEVMVMAPRTWSMETYSSISTQIRLAKGTHRVRIQFHGDGLNFDSFRFT